MESTKWSRNLSASNQSEISRMRKITKQKMENKRNRHQQPKVTSTRQQSVRTIKSAALRKSGLDDSAEDLIANNSSEEASNEEKLNKDKLIDQFRDNFETRGQESRPAVEKKENRTKKEETVKQRPKKVLNVSQTHSAEEDNADESSDEEFSAKNRPASKTTIEKSKSTFNLSEAYPRTNLMESNSSSHLPTTSLATSIAGQTKDINPLKSLLNNSELLEFVVNPVPRNKIYQCTIVRDKKGLDRSLYPTYYMHLQTINSKEDNQQLKVEDYRDANSSRRPEADSRRASTGSGTSVTLANGTAASNGSAHHPAKNGNANGVEQQVIGSEMHNNNRQVFLLSGRRRKKSKTYLISCNPFEITRQNSIAKLKSNIIGTEFNTLRILHNNKRLDYATIIYDTNVLGFKGPRKMTILLPKDSSNYYKQADSNNEVSLTGLNKIDPKSVIKLKNKTPVWNEETQSYVLNFKGRVTQASVKNFQLEICDLTEELENRSKEEFIETYLQQTDERSPTLSSTSRGKGTFMSNDFISMQFGRISNKEFTCDVSWPLSLLQAFSIALSSFDSKLACE